MASRNLSMPNDPNEIRKRIEEIADTNDGPTGLSMKGDDTVPGTHLTHWSNEKPLMASKATIDEAEETMRELALMWELRDVFRHHLIKAKNNLWQLDEDFASKYKLNFDS